MADPHQQVELELEVEASDSPSPLIDGGTWSAVVTGAGGDSATVSFTLSDTEDGHGFGATEIVTVVVSVASGVASDLIAGALRDAVGRVIRRARARTSATASGGAPGELADLLEAERAAVRPEPVSRPRRRRSSGPRGRGRRRSPGASR